MSVFLIAQINIHDEQQYAIYGDGFMEIFNRYNGSVLAVDEAPAVLEGEWAYTRTVLLQFRTREDADAWYNSEAYQALAQHRFAASEANIALIQSLDHQA